MKTRKTPPSKKSTAKKNARPRTGIDEVLPLVDTAETAAPRTFWQQKWDTAKQLRPANIYRNWKSDRAHFYTAMWPFFGWLHEIFAVVLSVVDVISDFLVAYEFYAAGHLYWAKAVMIEIFLANCIYTILAVEGTLRATSADFTIKPGHLHYRLAKASRWVQYPLCFLFGQFTPLFVWSNNVYLQWDKFINPSGSVVVLQTIAGTSIDVAQHLGEAAAEEVQRAEENAAVWGKFSGGWNDHVKRHMGFYIETIIEALPQCALQLLASTSTGEITNLQLFSIAISLVSVVSKAYLFSQSYDIRTFAFKFLLATIDVLSFFYFFATVLNPDEAKSPSASVVSLPIVGAFLPEIVVTPLTSLIVYKIFTFGVVLYFLTVLFIAAGTIDDYVNGHLRKDTLGVIAGFTVMANAAVIPFSVFTEVVKLSAASFFLVAIQGPIGYFPDSGALFDFLHTKKSNTSTTDAEDEDEALKQFQRKLEHELEDDGTSELTSTTKEASPPPPPPPPSVLEFLEYDRRLRFVLRRLVAHGIKRLSTSSNHYPPFEHEAYLRYEHRLVSILQPEKHIRRCEDENDEVQGFMERQLSRESALEDYSLLVAEKDGASSAFAKNARLRVEETANYKKTWSIKKRRWTSNCFFGAVWTRHIFMSRQEFDMIKAALTLMVQTLIAFVKGFKPGKKTIAVPFCIGAASILSVLGLVGISISVPYVFLHAFISFGVQNLNRIQYWSLVASIAAVVCAAPLFPSFRRYVIHNLIFLPFTLQNRKPLVRCFPTIGGIPLNGPSDMQRSAPSVARIAAEYHCPPLHGILCTTVPSGVLPADVLGVVASLLPATGAGSINTKTMSIAECKAFGVGMTREESELVARK